MTTTATAPETINALQLLRDFAHKRPCLDPSDYISDWRDHEGRRAYRRESAEITRDLHDFCELYRLAFAIVDNLAEKVENYLRTSSGRLTLTDSNKLQYITGQYFPTEYRPACSRVLVSILWREVMNQHETGHEIRAYFKKRLSRRVAKLYFN